MCQILINLVDILEKIFINIVNSVCEHHESVVFVIYDPKNIQGGPKVGIQLLKVGFGSKSRFVVLM